MKTFVAVALVLVFGFGCSSTSVRVIERADSLSSRPDWVSTTKTAYTDHDKTYFIGTVTVDGDASATAALNMSDEKAMSEPTRALVDDFFDQNQVGEDLRASTGKRLISSLRKNRVPMPGLTVTSRYWERVAIPQGPAPDKIELRVFSLAEIPTTEFEGAKKAAVAKLNADPEIKQDLEKVAAQQRDRAYEKDRTPASGK